MIVVKIAWRLGELKLITEYDHVLNTLYVYDCLGGENGCTPYMIICLNTLYMYVCLEEKWDGLHYFGAERRWTPL